jgi:hypothetical protein
MEATATADGRPLGGRALDDLEAMWAEAKTRERASG